MSDHQRADKLEKQIRQLRSLLALVVCLLLVIIWLLLPRPFETLSIVVLCLSVPATFIGVTYLLERLWPTRTQRSADEE